MCRFDHGFAIVMKEKKYYLNSKIQKDVEIGASKNDKFLSRRNIIIFSIIFVLLLVGLLAILIGGNRNRLHEAIPISNSNSSSKPNSKPNSKSNFKSNTKLLNSKSNYTSGSGSGSGSDVDVETVDPVNLLIRPIACNGSIIFQRKQNLEKKKKIQSIDEYLVSWSKEPEKPVCNDFWTISPDGSSLTKLDIIGIENYPDLCEISSPTYSNDGEMIAFVNKEDELYIMSSYGKNLKKFQISQKIRNFKFSSNDKEILFQSYNEEEIKVFAVNIKDKTTITTKFQTKFKSFEPLTFTQNEKFVLGVFEFGKNDNGMASSEFLVLNAKTGKIQSHFPINCEHHSISPDGKKIACIDRGKNHPGHHVGFFIDIADKGKEKHYFFEGSYNFRSFKWSPDGKFIAFQSTHDSVTSIMNIQCDKYIKNTSYDLFKDEEQENPLAIGEFPNWQPVLRYYD